jgi:hypothetical protein
MGPQLPPISEAAVENPASYSQQCCSISVRRREGARVALAPGSFSSPVSALFELCFSSGMVFITWMLPRRALIGRADQGRVFVPFD